jgi:hypothetical protein
MPVLQRISSVHLPNDKRHMAVKELVPLLKKKLHSDVSQSINLANAVFPMVWLPFPVDDGLLQALVAWGIWNAEEACFIKPPEVFTEAGIADWLNILGWMISLVYQRRCVCLWSAANCNLPPNGGPILQKPDLILIDHEEYENPQYERTKWPFIHAIREVSSKQVFPQWMFDTLNEKSYILFVTQDNHRFVPALSFDSSRNFSLTTTDRQGQIHMGVMSLLASGKEFVLVLMRILVCLIYGTPSNIGLDPSMICDPIGDVKSIMVDNKEFTVLCRVYALQSLIGRGTKVWIVIWNGQHYILKDSWVQSG